MTKLSRPHESDSQVVLHNLDVTRVALGKVKIRFVGYFHQSGQKPAVFVVSRRRRQIPEVSVQFCGVGGRITSVLSTFDESIEVATRGMTYFPLTLGSGRYQTKIDIGLPL